MLNNLPPKQSLLLCNWINLESKLDSSEIRKNQWSSGSLLTPILKWSLDNFTEWRSFSSSPAPTWQPAIHFDPFEWWWWRGKLVVLYLLSDFRRWLISCYDDCRLHNMNDDDLLTNCKMMVILIEYPSSSSCFAMFINRFSEKIALHTQKQAEETAAFEQIMKEVIGATRVSWQTKTGDQSPVSDIFLSSLFPSNQNIFHSDLLIWLLFDVFIRSL